MAGYLDAYGAGEERRERLIKRIVIWGLAVVIAGSALYFTFRNWRQEQVVKHFLSLLQQKQYQDAYRLWGCTQDSPCKYYPPDKFTEDWGPDSSYANAAAAKIDHVDACGAGVVFSISFPQKEPVALWVERDTNIISFAPWPRCPGRHWRIREFVKSLFS